MRPETHEIRLHDRQTLNTFTALVEMKPEMVPMLLKWITKHKFSVHEQALDNAITLKVEMFNFTLVHKQATEADLLQVLQQIHAERQDIIRD